jgi:hypothetical protein
MGHFIDEFDGVEFFQIRFEKIKGAIDSGQCGII